MARPHVPKFGNWDGGDNVPYTVYFDKARQGRSTGKIMNPNDPQENPELFAKVAPQQAQQPKAPQSKPVNGPEEQVVRGPVRPGHERRKSRENGEFRQFHESPASNENNNNLGRRTGTAHGGGRGGNNVRPVRKSGGSEYSVERSPLHPSLGKVAGKGSASPAWDGKSSYDSVHGTPDRSRMKPANRGRETPDRGAAVPKFGEWDENNPSSGDGYTHIFNKVREERHIGPKSPGRVTTPSYPQMNRQKYEDDDMKTCCFPWGRK